MKNVLCIASISVLFAGIAVGGDVNSGIPNPHGNGKGTSHSRATRLNQMQQAMDAQEQRIQELELKLQSRDSIIRQLQEQVSEVETVIGRAMHKEDTATFRGAIGGPSLVSIRRGDSEASFANMALTQQTVEKTEPATENPVAIRFKGITITPGGFLEAAGIYRTHNENGDVTSTFGNIPFSGSANSFLSEFRGTARQSRISLLAEGKVRDWRTSGYYEADFLGAAPTANEVQSNSFNPRQRQLWGQVEFKNGLSVLAGQTWSLLTTDRKGLGPLHEMIPLTIDSQYAVGYNWARQWGARVTKNLNDHVWAAFAIENPETTVGVINPPPGVFGLSNSPNAQSPNSQFTLSNTPGATGISTDVAPDLLAKMVFEPGWGHYELKALGRFFRDRVGGSNNYAGGGGGGLAAVLPATKRLDVIVEGLAGVGIGRYGDSVGPDVTLRPDGTIVPIRGLQMLAGLEWHPSSKWDFYAYGGDEYYGRAAYVNSSGKGTGYGSPRVDNSGCSVESPNAMQLCPAQTRTIWQVQPGFWHRFYKGPEGTIQFGMSYSYTYRNTWVGADGIQPKGIENMVMTSFRYYLP